MTDEAKDPGFLPPRKDRLLREHVHDTYKSRRKLPEPSVCPRCAAVYQEGRWQWASRPTDAREHVCPACHRTADKYPAGYVTLCGPFLAAHKTELINIARNMETREKAEHPLERIIDIEDGEDTVVITTTDPHLARGIGEALYHACDGELDFHYADESNVLRVSWKR